MVIQSRWIGEVIIYKSEKTTLREALCEANLCGANLCGANLSGADLSGANLSRANLSGADLSGANLSRANLCEANLSRANLCEANLSRADLCGADLSRADLSGANLSGADLSGANLSGANLSGANLSRANLSGANLCDARLPSPTIVFLALWGELSDDLTADLMVFDAACHPDPRAFDRWAARGRCPYDGVNVERVANFREKRDLWQPERPIARIYDLLIRILAEKCPDWTAEQVAAFETKFAQ